MTLLRSQERSVGVSVLMLMCAIGCGGGPTEPDPPPPPPPPSAVSLASLVAAPATTVGCGTAVLTATLSGPAPAGGATVNLASGTTAALTVPGSLAIAAGATSGTATATPVAATAPTTVTVTGTLAAGTGLAASSQNATVTLGAPIAAFSVSGTARGADACQLNAAGQVDCTFNGAASTGTTRWSWAWDVGTNTDSRDTTTPTLVPPTGCGLFSNATREGTAGNRFVQMIVRLTARDAGTGQSCVTRNANVRVFSGATNCGGF